MSLKYEAYARRLHLLAQIVLHGTANFSRPRTPHSNGAGELHGIPNARIHARQCVRDLLFNFATCWQWQFMGTQ
jgi:hypothetical protein